MNYRSTDTLNFHFYKDGSHIDFEEAQYRLEWKDNRIVTVKTPFDDFAVDYDRDGKIIKLRDLYTRQGGKVRLFKMYSISYNTEGKINKIEWADERQNSEGKVLSLTKRSIFTFTYNDGEVMVDESYYYDDEKPKKNIVQQEKMCTYRKTPNGFVKETAAVVKIVDRKLTRVDDDNPLIEEYELVNHRLIKQTSYFKQTPQSTNVLKLEYNNDTGFCTKMERIVNSLPKSISSFTYTLKSGADPKLVKSYDRSYLDQNLNEKGEIFEEFRDGKFRKKDANGNWTEWQFSRM
jgi:hypothetical protein